MKKTQLVSLTTAGILCALIAVMSAVPYTGYISYGVISITTLHIPVIIGAIALGPKWGTAIGTFWGISCLIRAFVVPQTPFDLLFQNPVYSVLPRILVGLVAGVVYKQLSTVLKNKQVIALYITGIIGALTNTVLVLGLLTVFSSKAFEMMGESVWNVMKIVLSVNGLLEIIAAPVAISAGAVAVMNALKRRR